MKKILTILFLVISTLAFSQSEFEEVIQKSNEGGFSLIERNAMYPGGINGINKLVEENLVYPLEAKRKKLEGTVLVNFVVETDGSVKEFEIIESVDPVFNKEAIRVLKLMTIWKPAIQSGKAIRQRFSYNIDFKLE